MKENLYEILEVPKTATQDEIKKSYRRLSMMYHPDKNKSNPDSTAKFQKISEAYETLGDPEKRNAYDMESTNPFAKMFSERQPASPEEFFASMFFGGMPFAHMDSFAVPNRGGPTRVRIFENGVEVNPSAFHQSMRKPTPIIKHIVVPIDKILSGTTIPVEIERWMFQNEIKVFENETLYVDVPKGIDEGEIIVIPNKGNVLGEFCKGDIKLFVKIQNDTEFKRSGLDLILEKTIGLKEALCGFSFELKYITGKVYTINNHSGNIISHGYRKIIPNMGFSRDNHVGNLIIIFNVTFPKNLSNEVMEQLKAINF